MSMDESKVHTEEGAHAPKRPTPGPSDHMEIPVMAVLAGAAAPRERTFKNKIIGFVSMHSVLIRVMIFPVLAAPYVVAGGLIDAKFLIFFFATLLGGIFVQVFNDVWDVERDRKKWPMRPLPTGLLSRRVMAVYMLIVGGLTLVIAGVVFNLAFLVGVFILFALNVVYVTYARDHIGVLTGVIPIATMTPVAWLAVAPGTILTALPWLLTLIHVTIAGIGQVLNEVRIPQKALFVTFTPSMNKALTISSAAGFFLISTYTFLYAHWAWPFMVVTGAFTVWALAQARYWGKPEQIKKLTTAFRAFTQWNAVFWTTMAVVAWI